MLNRRFVIRGLIAAPAIVVASNIMPVRSIERLFAANREIIRIKIPIDIWRHLNMGVPSSEMFLLDDNVRLALVESGFTSLKN